ncbi:hypothetical protein ABH994_006462 [Bradyrhizobium yuanmingense]|uniref:IstB-like ATP-binding domain-containing protein n=1 Tax=Bradyrhizobium yuanmingense TaxID=108015 RepID=A0ABV4GJS6_9BRAD
MLITSNRSVAEWGTVFADPVVATAILDRLLHHSHVLTIRGDSYRLRAKSSSNRRPPVTAVRSAPPPSVPSPAEATIKRPMVGQFFMTKRGQFRMAFDRLCSRLNPGQLSIKGG